MKNIEVVPYSGTRQCCDCGHVASFTVKVDGFQFTVCKDCVSNFEEEEND